jgi:hypothetical protein
MAVFENMSLIYCVALVWSLFATFMVNRIVRLGDYAEKSQNCIVERNTKRLTCQIYPRIWQ